MQVAPYPAEWHETWKIILGLWPEWKPTPQTIKWLFDRWAFLHQDKLRDSIEVHRLEAGAEKAGRPVFNRVMELYQQRTPYADIQRTQTAAASIQVTDQEITNWGQWADKIVASATPQELAEVQERFAVVLQTKRYLAVAIQYHRDHPKKKSANAPRAS